jgi:hypothetical protein
MSGKQGQPYTREPVYQVSLRHAFSAAVSPTVTAAGSFPSTADKIALSAAQSSKIMSPFGLGLTAGDLSLDDANDRILLEPGVYRVEVGLLLVENGTDSDYHVALTTAAQAATDVSYTNVHGAVMLSASSSHFHTVQYLTVTAARALELHVAWQTVGATGTIRPGSFIEVRRVGNIDS